MTRGDNIFKALGQLYWCKGGANSTASVTFHDGQNWELEEAFYLYIINACKEILNLGGLQMQGRQNLV